MQEPVHLWSIYSPARCCPVVPRHRCLKIANLLQPYHPIHFHLADMFHLLGSCYHDWTDDLDFFLCSLERFFTHHICNVIQRWRVRLPGLYYPCLLMIYFLTLLFELREAMQDLPQSLRDLDELSGVDWSSKLPCCIYPFSSASIFQQKEGLLNVLEKFGKTRILTRPNFDSRTCSHILCDLCLQLGVTNV